ncbi:MAG: hypothetical protein D6726_08115 [Nitrospirae bacterium]|nr:MAG: hypothetical protein D6726_08115 [Nitrospirota bacterium]
MFSPSFALMVLLYWGFLTGVVFLAGASFVRQFVTMPTGVDFCPVEGKKLCYGEASIRIVFFASVLTFVLNLLHLFFHASVMTETPLSETFSVFRIFLLKTAYGKLGILRTAFLVLLITAISINMKQPARWKDLTSSILSLLLIISISLSSHQAMEGFNRPFVYLDMAHIAGISLWIGGLFFVRFCYSFFFLNEAGADISLFRKMIKRYSDIATWAVYTAGVTGIILLLFRVKSTTTILHTPYGIIMILKILSATLILTLGGLNKFFLIPKLLTDNNKEILAGTRRLLHRTITIEAWTGLLVMLITAVLTHLSPEM